MFTVRVTVAIVFVTFSSASIDLQTAIGRRIAELRKDHDGAVRAVRRVGCLCEASERVRAGYFHVFSGTSVGYL